MYFCHFQIKRLEEENEMLRNRLIKREQTANVIEIDDDDEDDDEYESEDSDESSAN